MDEITQPTEATEDPDLWSLARAAIAPPTPAKAATRDLPADPAPNAWEATPWRVELFQRLFNYATILRSVASPMRDDLRVLRELADPSFDPARLVPLMNGVWGGTDPALALAIIRVLVASDATLNEAVDGVSPLDVVASGVPVRAVSIG